MKSSIFWDIMQCSPLRVSFEQGWHLLLDVNLCSHNFVNWFVRIASSLFIVTAASCVWGEGTCRGRGRPPKIGDIPRWVPNLMYPLGHRELDDRLTLFFTFLRPIEFWSCVHWYCHLIDCRRVLDWWWDLLSNYTARDHTLQITSILRPVFLVTLLGNGF
jgi:hypothetical protein